MLAAILRIANKASHVRENETPRHLANVANRKKPLRLGHLTSAVNANFGYRNVDYPTVKKAVEAVRSGLSKPC